MSERQESGKSLRDALEQLIQRKVEQSNGVDTEWSTVTVRDLRDLLAAHPVDSAPGIRDDALKALVRVLLTKAYAAGMSRYNSGKINPPSEVQKIDQMVADFEDAASPILGARP